MLSVNQANRTGEEERRLRFDLIKLYLSLNQTEKDVQMPTNTRSQRIKDIKQQIWKIEGELKFNLPQSALTKVLQRHASIGLVPEGYFYPELLEISVIPRELQQCLKNK